MLGWLVDERGIEPRVKVFDKSERPGGTFSRSDFACEAEGDLYVCPGGKKLRKRRRIFSSLRSNATKAGTMIYRASKLDCGLRAQAQVLREHGSAQDRALCP
jgi:hypothetical protein